MRLEGDYVSVFDRFAMYAFVTWLVVLGVLVFVAATLDLTVGGGVDVPDRWIVAIVVSGLIAFAMVWYSNRRARRLLEDENHLLCLRCRYSLRASGAEGVCPECGIQFDAEQVQAAWNSRYPEMPKYRSD